MWTKGGDDGPILYADDDRNHLKAEITKYAKVITESGAKADTE